MHAAGRAAWGPVEKIGTHERLYTDLPGCETFLGGFERKRAKFVKKSPGLPQNRVDFERTFVSRQYNLPRNHTGDRRSGPPWAVPEPFKPTPDHLADRSGLVPSDSVL